MKRSGLLLAAASLLLTGYCAAADPPPTQTVPLKFIEPSHAVYHMGQSLKDCKGEMPFPNKSGKLLMEYKSGKLFVDSNDDGKINGKDEGIKPDNNAEKAKMAVDAVIHGHPAKVMLFVNNVYEQGDKTHSVIIGATGGLEGKLNGKTVRLLFPANSTSPQINYIQSASGDQPINQVPMTRWSKTMAIGNLLYSADLDWSSPTLNLTQYTGPIAKVKLQINAPEKAGCEATFAGTDQVAQVTANDFALMVPGKYSLQNGHLNIKDDKGGHKCVSGRSADKETPFEFREGENVVPLGGPFNLDFTAHHNGDQIEFTALDAIGCSQERYGLSGGTAIAYISSNGKEQELKKLEFG